MEFKRVTVILIIFSLIATLFLFHNENNSLAVIYDGQPYLLDNYQNFNALNLTSRTNIYTLIRNNPGTHLRNICSSLGISMGTAQYHLDQLVKSNLIEFERDSKYKRFFLARKFSDFEKKLLCYLRKPTSKRIIAYALDDGGCSHQELADLIGISSQAITWHVKRLMSDNVLESYNLVNSTNYLVAEETRKALISFNIHL
jgi:predicted transcriptional regulator